MKNIMTRPMIDRLYIIMTQKGISTSALCKELNVNYPNFKSMLEGKQPCFGTWQRKIAKFVGVERKVLFKEFLDN